MKNQTSQSLNKFSKHPYSKKAYKYALDIVNEKIDSCDLVKKACQRFLKDLDKKDFQYFFDPNLGDRICHFAEMLPHVKGKWARAHSVLDRLIKLEPWQCFIFANIAGWVDKKTGLRRYREAYIEVPRKNGKSVIAAVIGLYFFVADKEPGAEIYCGATSEKQAMEVFRPARRMCALRPELATAFGIKVYKEKLELDDESQFTTIIGKPGDGSSPHLAILDEYHQHADSSAYDAMQTGMGAREQPLLLIITTAGFNIESPCYEKHEECEKVLKNVVEDDQLFSVIYSIDKEDDPFTLAAVKKANPNFGVSVMEDYLLHQAQTAERSPSLRNKYLVKHLNVWTTADETFFNIQRWLELGDPTLRAEDFRGCRSIIAVDLASKIDLLAVVEVFVKTIDRKKHYFVFAHHYLPEDTINDTENANFKIYQKYIRTPDPEGEPVLTSVPGSETDFEILHDDLLTLWREDRPHEMAFDIWNAQELMMSMQKDGVNVVEIPQQARNLSPGMKEIESAMSSGRIHHNGDPILSWCISNVVAHEDTNGNYKPNKPKRSAKIDGAVALIMAVSRAMLMQGQTVAEAIAQGHGVRRL